MNKIPVGRTIAHAYGFAFGRYPTVLGIVWVPLLISLAMLYFLRLPELAQAHSGMFDPQPARVNFLVQIAGIVLFAIISVGINKEVLGLPRGPRFFYVGFGGAELRVIVGYFALVLLFIVFVVAFVLAVLVLGFIARTVANQLASGGARVAVAFVLALVALSVWLALLYAMVRLTFLFVPSTVAENRIGIMRSWELTAGNFWRIFAIGICVLLPLIAIAIVLTYAVLGPGYFAFAMQHAHDAQAIQNYVAQRVAALYGYMPLLLLGSLAINPVLYGLMVSPASFAYRALVPAIVPTSIGTPPQAIGPILDVP